jgi:predicted ATPase
VTTPPFSLLSVLAQRQEAARLFVLGTYRPADMVAGEHSLPGLTQELLMHGYCEELALPFLSEAAVGEYVARQFSVDEQTSARLTELIHTRTDGNPLFVVNLLDYLVAQGNLIEVNGKWELQAGMASMEEIKEGQGRVPDNLRHMIEKQIERLSAGEQRLLEIASVAGIEFSAAALAVSDAQGEGTVEAEESCDALARQGKFLHANGWNEWPDGTIAGRYQFIHSLYQNVLYHRIPAGRRLQLHRAIGNREERGYGQRAAEVAAELAIHFEHGRVFPRAVYYLQHAADNALQRCAYQEAINHLSHGLSLVQEHDYQSGNSVPEDTSEHMQQEIALSLTLGVPLAITKGYAAPEVEQTYSHARDLCEEAGETRQLFRALRGLRAVSLIRAEFPTARRLGEQLLVLAERHNDPTLLLSAHDALGITYFHTGDLTQARSHLEHGLALYDPQKRRSNGFVQDPGVVCLSYSAFALCVLGSFGQARDTVQHALSLARDLAHPHSLAYALGCAAIVSQMCRDEHAAQAFAEETITLSTEQGFAYWLAMGTILHGGVEQIVDGLAAWRATGAEAMRPYYLCLLAEAYVTAGQAQEGLQVVAEALELVEITEERFCEAELYRLKGEGLLARESKEQGAESKTWRPTPNP